jgi:hypothetical protein
VATQAGVVEDDLDRLHALGGAPSDRPTATDKLGELRSQRGVQALQEPRSEAATFARHQTQSRVRADAELDARERTSMLPLVADR